MPVILPRDAEAAWLDPAVSKEHALSLLQPYPAELMLALPASTRTNSIRNETLACSYLTTLSRRKARRSSERRSDSSSSP